MDKSLIIREPETAIELDAMFDLRWRVLRKPWDLSKGSEKDSLEEKTIQIIAIIGNKVVGLPDYREIHRKWGKFVIWPLIRNIKGQASGSK